MVETSLLRKFEISEEDLKASEKGDRWVERIFSLRQTRRLHSKSTYHVLVDAMRSHFKGQQPDLSWIAQA